MHFDVQTKFVQLFLEVCNDKAQNALDKKIMGSMSKIFLPGSQYKFCHSESFEAHMSACNKGSCSNHFEMGVNSTINLSFPPTLETTICEHSCIVDSTNGSQ